MKTSPNNHGNFLMPSIMLSKARADGFSWESLPSSTATGNITSQSRLLMHLPTNMLTKLSSIEDVSSQKMVTKTKRLQMMILPDERLCYSMTWPWKPTIEGIYGTRSCMVGILILEIPMQHRVSLIHSHCLPPG